MSDGYAATLRRMFGHECRTDRGLQNVYYRLVAIRAIGDDPRCAYVWDAAAVKGGRDVWQPTILSELGRIPGTKHIRACARIVSREAMAVGDAIKYIREYRSALRWVSDLPEAARAV